MRAIGLLAITIALAATRPGAQADLTGRYTVEEGFDRPGSTYETFEQTGEYQAHVLCRDACFSQPRCKAYTFVRPGVAGSKAFCRLKDQAPGPVEDDCCISAVKGGAPKQPAVSSLRLQWFGWDADKVGKAPDPQMADGAPDHRFVLQVRPPATQEVLAVSLRPASAGAVRWSSTGAPDEYLAVEAEGRRLNPVGPGLRLPGAHAGARTFDLYAHDIGQFGVGRVVKAEVTLGGGRTITHEFELAPPPDRLLGVWQMHCANTPPHMFEPMTQSGRMQLSLRPDGGVAGFFGAMPLTGRVGEDGSISGAAEGGGARVVWKGTLEKTRRGKPLKGGGSFELAEAQGGCAGHGSWGSQ